MSEKTINKIPNVPNLRFREFHDSWIEAKLSDFSKKIILKNVGNKISNVISNSAQTV